MIYEALELIFLDSISIDGQIPFLLMASGGSRELSSLVGC